MIIAIDIGNSNVVIGVHNGELWRHTWRLPTLIDETMLFYEMRLADHLLEAGISPDMVKKVVLSSVVPQLTGFFVELSQILFHRKALIVGPDVYPALSLRIDRPHEIGADLVANAAAAHYRFRQDCIIVDFGTALTFTVVTGEGYILGVAIAPGLRTAVSSLFQKTAQLPEVPLELPQSAVGKNTAHAIQSGILLGYVGLVRHLLAEIRVELGEHYIAIATGGLSSILHPLRHDFHAIEPHLTLDGLRVIGEAAAGK
jgi:type III pantothenate kinase